MLPQIHDGRNHVSLKVVCLTLCANKGGQRYHKRWWLIQKGGVIAYTVRSYEQCGEDSVLIQNYPYLLRQQASFFALDELEI